MTPKRVKRRLHLRILRRLWHLTVTLVVLLAVYTTGGRLLMARVGGQVAEVETQLAQLLGATVTIGDLRGGWLRFSPTLEIRELTLVTGNTASQHGIQQLTIELDAIASLLDARPVIRSIYAKELHLTLQEDANGRWMLAGLAGGNSPDYSQQILDFILETRGIGLAEATLHLQRADGSAVTIDSLYLELRNRGNLHDAQSQFRINGQQNPAHVALNLEGDPRAVFMARLYANTEALELGPLLAARETGGWQLQNLRVGGSVWLDADQNGVQQVRTELKELNAAAVHLATQRRVTLENASFSGYARPVYADASLAPGWDLGFANMAFDWQQTPWEIPSLQMSFSASGGNAVTLRAGSLELGMLRQLVETTVELPANVASILDTLAPQGFLRNVQFETARDGAMPGSFLLRANLTDVAVQAWGGAPSGRGLQGYLQMDDRSGFAEVDSNDIDLHLPHMFAEAWHYDHLNTRVHWLVNDDSFRVGSTAIDVRNSTLNKSLDGRVQFDLYSSLDAAGEQVSEFSLLVGMRTMDVALRSAYLPTLAPIRPTMDWLQAALQSGRVYDSGFMMRTSTVPNAPPASNTFATWYHVDNGSLQFLPDWPPLENIMADVVVRDGNVTVQTSAASIAGIALNPALGTVLPAPAGGSLLTVRGTASTDTGTGLAFLRESPVRNAIGPFIDNWQASGQIAINIALDIPLSGNVAAGEAERIIDVNVLSTDSELALPDYALTISAINGPVRYHSASGLTANALSARLFDFPIVVGIETNVDVVAGPSTRITSRGHASVTALQAWPLQPAFVRNLLDYSQGEISYGAMLDILHRAGADGIRTRLNLTSDLLGMESSLPRPFTQTVDEGANIELNLAFQDRGQLLTASYADVLSAQLVLDDGGIDRGQVYFGDRNRDFNIRQSDTDTPGLLLNGELPYFNYEQWETVADELATKAGTVQRPLAEYLRLIDVNVELLEIAGQQFEDISVQVQVDTDGWQIDGANALLRGHLTIPMNADPWNVNLDYLRFPPRPEPELDAEGTPLAAAEVDLLAAVDPSTLPPFDFATAELNIGEQGLGAFSFLYRPDNSGATIADFRMQAPDSSITDQALTGGANIDWRYNSGMHTSSFNGVFSAVDLAQVLPRWGHDANVESKQASFSGTLQWNGSPLAFSLEDSSGQLLLDIRNGRFVDIQAGTARVFGALNFEALVRRLQLDFSDIFQSGYNFDSISGNLALVRGVVTTNGPAVIDGPSSKISINGEIDLAQETIAADMEVQIPLGQNLSLLAGLLVSWPVALSTYVASLIFAEEVADFATVIYRLDGPWENPAAGFEAPESADTQEP